MQPKSPTLTAGWRGPVWIALLAAASVAFSLGFACAAPLAAFAAIAALTMPRVQALLLVGSVWLVNQAVGFGVLQYPWTADCLAWGVASGAIALLATLGSAWAARRVAPRAPVAAGAAFLTAFTIHEGLFFIASVIVASGVENYSAAGIARIFLINAAAFGVLLVLNKLGASVGLAPAGRGRLAATGRSGLLRAIAIAEHLRQHRL